MNSASDRLWHTVARQAFLAAQPDLDYTWLVLHKQSHGLTPQSPLLRKVRDAIVDLKSSIYRPMS